jgi:hypothetical protein
VVYGACTVAFLNKFLDGNLYNLRVAPRLMRYDPHRVSQFMERVDSRTQAWNFGDGCGWHCSWCLNAEGIRFKMLAAHFSDLPRWGSMKGKRDLGYLTNITAAGVWFDGKTLLTRVNASDSHFAPKYVLANRARYARFARPQLVMNVLFNALFSTFVTSIIMLSLLTCILYVVRLLVLFRDML